MAHFLFVILTPHVPFLLPLVYPFTRVESRDTDVYLSLFVQLTLKSSTQKYTPSYKLKVSYEAPSGKKWEDKEIEGSFTQWFNTHGYLQKKELQSWLAENIEVLGVAQKEGKAAIEPATEIPAIDDATLIAISGAGGMTFSSGADAVPLPPVPATPSTAKKGRSKKKT